MYKVPRSIVVWSSRS